jgi:hypothetical protein
MKSKGLISALFIIAAIYDGVLGLVFLFIPDVIFKWFEVTPPNHLGYAQFPAALLVVFAILFFSIARRPHENRNLIPYGCLLKVSYCGVVFGHWLTGGIPNMWKPFAIIDLFFLLFFLLAFQALGKETLQQAPFEAEA